MIDLIPFVSSRKLFTLLIAPPAWGKTRLLIELFKKTQQTVIYIAPLRALINEFSNTIKGAKIKCFNLGEESIELKVESIFEDVCIVLTTPERFFSNRVDTFINEDTLIIIDELHLFFSWGESFRPVLFELLMFVGAHSITTLGLSATIGPEILTELKTDFTPNYLQLIVIDLGNRKLKYSPDKHYWYPSKLNIFRKIFNQNVLKTIIQSENVVLVFVQYRKQVDTWVDFLQRQGVSALGCKGGDVVEFTKQLQQGIPKCIISTTCLSHGVNLPTISDVFISYKIVDQDFWIQMVGRGGRNGESYSLHHMNSLQFSKKELIVSLLNSLKLKYFSWKLTL